MKHCRANVVVHMSDSVIIIKRYREGSEKHGIISEMNVLESVDDATSPGFDIDAVFNDKSRLPGMLDEIDVRLLWAYRDFLPAGHWNYDNLANDFWRVYQNNVDGGVLAVAGRQVPLQKRGVYIVPSGLPLSSRNDADITQFYVHFDLRGVPPFAFRELFPGPVLVPDVSGFHDSVEDLGERVARHGSSDLATQCRIKGTVYEAFGHYLGEVSSELIERSWKRMAALEPVLAALHMIEDRLDQVIRNGDLAAACNLSEDYFIHKFRDATGFTPTAFIRKRRVAMGAQLLLFTTESIESIATKTGFTDRFYFSRVFTRETGHPPAAYRRSPRT
jgi:AraC-like DNA-binding protein